MGIALKILSSLHTAGQWWQHQWLRLFHIDLRKGRNINPDPLPILYQSPNFIVVNKGHDVVINGTDHSTSVQKQLSSSMPHLVDGSVVHQFRFPHRLDYATSGALCIALNRRAARCAMEAFLTRSVEKYYLAVLRGHPERERSSISLSIGQDSRPGNTHRMCAGYKSYCVDRRKALTRMVVLQKGLYDGTPAVKVLLQPSTGRRHQLRVHCMEIGHPVVGDYTYSDRKDVVPHRMFLHALRLVLPTTDETIDVTTPDPFEADVQNKWVSTITLNRLDEGAFAIFSQRESFVEANFENNKN